MTFALLALSSLFLSLPNTRAFVVRNYPQQQHPKVSPFSTLKHHAKIQAVSDKNKDGFMSSDDNSDDNNRWISQERKKRQQKKQQQRQFRILDEEGENDETSKNNEECYYLDDDGNNNNMEDMRALVDEVAESLDLSRESFRMESFSSYTIVSILTATASFSTIQENLTEHDVVGNTLHACTLLFALVAALCGVYATVVFAMTNTVSRSTTEGRSCGQVDPSKTRIIGQQYLSSKSSNETSSPLCLPCPSCVAVICSSCSYIFHSMATRHSACDAMMPTKCT